MMKKIYLFCSAGMSTSMLAQKMQEVGDAHNLPVEVKAFSHSKIGDIVEQLHPDCILLGPQVKYLYEETAKRFATKIPVALIDSSAYGMMDGEKVLKTAIKLIKAFTPGEN